MLIMEGMPPHGPKIPLPEFMWGTCAWVCVIKTASLLQHQL